jgi:hypothetical protein
VDAAERAAREREARIAKFLRRLRDDLVLAGVDRSLVESLSTRELIERHSRAFRQLQATPPGGR